MGIVAVMIAVVVVAMVMVVVEVVLMIVVVVAAIVTVVAILYWPFLVSGKMAQVIMEQMVTQVKMACYQY